MTAPTTVPAVLAPPQASANDTPLARAMALAEAAIASGRPAELAAARAALDGAMPRRPGAPVVAAPVDPVAAEFPRVQPNEYARAAGQHVATEELDVRMKLHQVNDALQRLRAEVAAEAAEAAAAGAFTAEDRIVMQRAAMLGHRAPPDLQRENLRVTARANLQHRVASKQAQIQALERSLSTLMAKARTIRQQLPQFYHQK